MRYGAWISPGKLRNTASRAQFEDLARQWEQIASDIEKYRQQIDCFGLSADLLIKRERGNPDGGEANA